jgi:hypothetical protein
MRFADNFNPEWGYLAPAPSFMRTARVAFVAASIGAISGAGVVFSLIDHPAAEEVSTAARTLVLQSTPAFVAEPRTATLQAPHEIGTAPAHWANPRPARLAESEPDSGSAPAGLANASVPVAAAMPTSSAKEAAVASDTSPLQKRAIKRQQLPQQRLTWRAPEPAFGSARTPLALLPSGSYPMRGQYSGAYEARGDF